jgi:hypothetical protein
MIPAAGHEVGNHSFNHEPWLHLYSRGDLHRELAQTEEVLARVTGKVPRGFRGPGYSKSPALLDVLAERGYLYDASTLPTFLGPLARAYYLATAKLTPEERETRKKLFGTFRDGLRPLNPYVWELYEGRRLLEIPVTTLPLFRVPIHFSYLLFLSRFSELAARTYFREALRWCRWSGTQPSLLFHPLDFLGGDDVSELAFFPAMDVGGKKKVEFLHWAMELILTEFEVVTMAEHARRMENRPLPVFEGRLAGATQR